MESLRCSPPQVIHIWEVMTLTRLELVGCVFYDAVYLVIYFFVKRCHCIMFTLLLNGIENC